MNCEHYNRTPSSIAHTFSCLDCGAVFQRARDDRDRDLDDGPASVPHGAVGVGPRWSVSDHARCEGPLTDGTDAVGSCERAATTQRAGYLLCTACTVRYVRNLLRGAK